MKKIISLIITLFYISTNACFAFSELYYLKNTTTTAIQPLIVSSYSDQNFKIQKQNPYYGINSNDSSEYAIVILQQSGSNLFYYYSSNTNKKLNKKILKSIKKAGIVTEQSLNQNIIGVYDNLAQNTLNPVANTNRYTFEDPKPVVYNQTTTNIYNQGNSLQGYVAQVSEGSKIATYLQNPINTATAAKGDRITAVLTKNWTYNGHVIAPQGSVVYGTLIKARPASYGSRNGRVVIDFNQLVTPENKVYNISTEEIDFTVTNEGKIARSAGSVVAGAAIGALAGLLIGAIGSGNVGSTAAIGAGIGAGSALIGTTAERGIDAEIPSFTELELTLTQPLNVTISY
ncbi:hypothetical protein IJ579_01775 [bacterium]|nr:hypothetical protein [bacterium]